MEATQTLTSSCESPVPYIREQAARLQSALREAPGGACERLLSASLDQLHAAHQAFIESARHALTTTLLAFSIGGTGLWAWVTSEAPRSPAQSGVICALSAAAFAVPLMLRGLMLHRSEATNDLYISAAIHARIVTVALNVPCTHRSLDMVESCAMARGRLESTNTASDPNAFPHSDAWVFQNGTTAVGEHLTSAGRIRAVYEAWTPSLLTSHRTLFGVWIPCTSGLLIALTLALGASAAVRPDWFWPTTRTALPQLLTPVTPPPVVAALAAPPDSAPAFAAALASAPTDANGCIGVHVTSNGQTPSANALLLRIPFGPQFSLDRQGECRICEPHLGSPYELVNASGRVLKSGVLPQSGGLFIQLE